MKYSDKIPFPFTDLSGEKSRPALVGSNLDDYSDLRVLLIATSDPDQGANERV